eukprot:6775577-Ditylum_brightwellii.AAC.1
MPDGERSLYVRLTSKKLQENNKAPTNLQKIDLFVASLYALTRASKKGGIVCAFNKQSDEAPDSVEEDTLDYYWNTDQLIHCFNKYYHTNSEHSWKATMDERIF